MKHTVKVFATTSFVGFHRWPQAPESVAYLRDRHRHLFKVRIEKLVRHENRDIEFITLKQLLDHVINEANTTDAVKLGVAQWSCETWATYLLARLSLCKCEVSEDGENGAVAEHIDD